MSILKKPYELSVWYDEWNGEKYEEKRLGIIGTDTMSSQNRALKLNLTRNINGVKKLSFEMYKRYKDNITGEWEENPFISWLVNERKVKLKYGKTPEGEDRWYDFIIKDISENSTTYLCTYQLEDALVQELSKNGFGVVLDEKIRDENGKSNMGTVRELAEKVLSETDWNVESDVFVQKIEEALVYINIPSETEVTQIIDPIEESTGVTTQSATIGGEALAFYSSCKGQPYRFQFIYLSDGYGTKDNKISQDENRIINIQNCQYYYDVFAEGKEYCQIDEYYLPEGWSLVDKGDQGIDNRYDTSVSNWYRGERYGFSQDAEYIPLLDRYCSKFYKKDTTTEVYGFIDNKYDSPILVQNVITNTEFKSTTGWVGTYSGQTPNAKQNYGITIEAAYGHFVDDPDSSDKKIFSSVVKELQEGTYSTEKKYTPYLKITVPAGTSLDSPILINTGFYDNRTSIGSVSYNEQWVLNHTIRNSVGGLVSGFDFKLREVEYDIDSGNYNLGLIWAEQNGNLLQFNAKDVNNTTHADVEISANNFKTKEIKLVITPESSGVYYLEKLELYKAIPKTAGGTDYMAPGELDQDGVITTTYNFFTQEQLEAAKEEKDIAFDKKAEGDWYDNYVPKFNTGAEKVRSVTAKESNYFNILQSIAETFEAWLHLEVVRAGKNDPDGLTEGSIKQKKIRFKKYVGNENHAAFRYGVNLKNIQRTYASKNIVTKLIVKQNSNEHAKNGFCTIARANSNPTGENYIYDFRHFHDEGLMDSKDYVALVYGKNGVGPDLKSGTEEECDLVGYYSRIKNLNDQIIPINEDIVSLSTDLTKLNAEKTVEENSLSAAESQLEEVREDFELLTGLSIENISPDDFKTIEILSTTSTTNQDWAEGATITCVKNSKTDWTFKTELSDLQFDETELVREIKTHPESSDKVTWKNGTLSLDKDPNSPDDKWLGLRVNLTNGYQEGTRYRLSFVISNITGVLNKIGGHNASFANPTIKIWYGDSRYKDVPDASISNHNVLAVEQKTSYYVEFEGTFCKNSDDNTPVWFIQPNRLGYDCVSCNITDIKIQKYKNNLSSRNRTFNFDAVFKLTPILGEATETTKKLSCSIPAYSTEGTLNYTFNIIDLENEKVSSLLTEYATLRAQISSSNKKLNGDSAEGLVGLSAAVSAKEDAIKAAEEQRDILLGNKKLLNKLFYTRFSRFIQEGTWISEEYVDDDSYYNDALSVIYNSCRSQVAYTINVLELSRMPGYEMFEYELGDRTYAIDPDFFGDEGPRSITISEINENLDDPTQNTIKVQNFKDQFKDLFQKITATVQQTQYSTGAYEKAVALAEADAEQKGDFLQSALNLATAKLSVGGQDTVVSDTGGITITDKATQDQMRLVGGAILMSVQDQETGERIWKTGLTPEGISASLVTAGTINAGDISIMNVNEPVFRWDSFGLTAFDAEWGGNSTIGRPNKNKFVRFDKHGIYGINNDGDVIVDGLSWKPSSIDEVDEKATFALTWEGLKVSGNDGVAAHIGRLGGNILRISQGSTDLLKITNSGSLEMTGIIHATGGDFSGNITATGTITGGTIVGSEIKNDSSGSIFKLNSSGGEIAGWKIGSNALHTSNNSLYLGSTGITAKIGLDSRDNLVFKAGDNFGVAADGTIYAARGKIGTVEIGKVASTDTTDELNDLIAEVNDSKAESFYQNTDPADYDGDDAWGENEKGNLWCCTTDEEDGIGGQVSTSDTSTIKRKKNGEYIWTDITSEIEVEGEEQKQTLVGYGWKEKDIPNIVFDAYDGRATIFTGDATKQEYPVHYKIGDFWILPEAATINVKKCKKNAILSSSSDSEDFDATHWSEIDYTNDDAAIAAQGTANEAKEGLNDKLDLTNKNNETTGFRYLWADNGLSIWDKNLDSTSPEVPNEKNTIFTIYQNTDKKYELKMKGSGEFTGTITAEGGYIGDLVIENGGISGPNNTGLRITSTDVEATRLQTGGMRIGPYKSFWETTENNAPSNMLAHWKLPNKYQDWHSFVALTSEGLEVHTFEGQDGQDRDPDKLNLQDLVKWGHGKIVVLNTDDSRDYTYYNIFSNVMTGWIGYQTSLAEKEYLLLVNGLVCAKVKGVPDFDPETDTTNNAGINWWLGDKNIQWD